MRVTGGSLGGRALLPPADRTIRPTADRIRQAWFNILDHNDFDGAWAGLDGVAVIDAFCGTGALGIEALSRGAASCVFLDRDAASLALCRRNLAVLGLVGHCLRGDATRSPPGQPPGQPAGLILLDPPYADGPALATQALTALAASFWLASGALCCVELPTRAKLTPPDGFTARDRRAWGDISVVFLSAPVLA